MSDVYGWYSGKKKACRKVDNRQARPVTDGNGPYLYGAERDRTADLMNAIHALSQLSYCPERPI